jgi:threonine dehydrogenase-like Zn-dependent dehydrogenase
VRNTDAGIAVLDVPAPGELTDAVRGLLPDDPGVRVRVASAGICGSDLHPRSRGLTLTLGQPCSLRA